MDAISHVLTGYVISKAVAKGLSHKETFTILIASLIPDIDYVVRIAGVDQFLKHHRGLSHSLFGGLLLAIALAVIFRLFFANTRFSFLFFLALIGVSVHIFLDLATSYGTKILLPFSDRWYALDWVMIVDVFVSGALIGGTIFIFLFPQFQRKISLGVILFLSLFFLTRGYLHNVALGCLKENKALSAETIKIGAFPFPYTPFKWRGIIETKDAYFYRIIDVLDPYENRFTSQQKIEDNQWITKAKRGKLLSTYLKFARFPVASYKRSNVNYLVTYYDLRFSSRGREGFKVTVLLSPEGKILNEKFRF